MNEFKNISNRERKRAKPPVTFDMLEHGKLPPQAVDLEEAVLGSILLEREAMNAVVDILQSESFYKDSHKIIYEAIHNLFKRSEPIDILTVTQELKKTGYLEAIGGAYYITQLTNRVASSANVEFHARIISQKYIQRELIKISSEIIRDAYDETTDVLELMDDAEKKLFSVTEGNIRKTFEGMPTLILQAIKQIEAAKSNESNIVGVPSGFTALDRVTSGWQPSDLIIIAARPAMGKTAFVLSLVRNISVQFGKPAAIFSLEMSSLQLVTRFISAESELTSEKLRSGNLAAHEMEQLHAKIGGLSEAPIFIDDTPALSIFELRAKARRLRDKEHIEILIVDYLQLMTVNADNRGNREQEISQISRSLKSIAKELNIPVIALSQLNRSVESRQDKKPILSDLRESGSIEQDADMVLFLHRPEYYGLTEDENGNPTHGVANIIIAKHRNGGTGTINVKFINHLAKFTDLDFEPSTNSAADAFSPMSPSINFDTDHTITRPSKMNDDSLNDAF
ncbi:MAG: replicative DNA helicase [Flavobacteriales bacterium]|nr:replicative DNA helicase [Flavobacteriales bacterium]